MRFQLLFDSVQWQAVMMHTAGGKLFQILWANRMQNSAVTLSTQPASGNAQHATKLTNKPRPIVKNMYYNKSYLGKTSYSIVSDIGKYACRHARLRR